MNRSFEVERKADFLSSRRVLDKKYSDVSTRHHIFMRNNNIADMYYLLQRLEEHYNVIEFVLYYSSIIMYRIIHE